MYKVVVNIDDSYNSKSQEENRFIIDYLKNFIPRCIIKDIL
ncbi:MAG: hypothetical protein ACOCRO_11885 [Halanaerobiales bacterium]